MRNHNGPWARPRQSVCRGKIHVTIFLRLKFEQTLPAGPKCLMASSTGTMITANT